MGETNLQAYEAPRVSMYLNKNLLEYPGHTHGETFPTPTPSPTKPPAAMSLVNFKACVNDDYSVTLVWKTAYKTGNAGFNVYRSKRRGGTYKKVNETPIPAEGNGTFNAHYSFKDEPISGKYYYKLEGLDTNGTSILHGPLKVMVRSKKCKAIKRFFGNSMRNNGYGKEDVEQLTTNTFTNFGRLILDFIYLGFLISSFEG